MKPKKIKNDKESWANAIIPEVIIVDDIKTENGLNLLITSKIIKFSELEPEVIVPTIEKPKWPRKEQEMITIDLTALPQFQQSHCFRCCSKVLLVFICTIFLRLI